MIGISANCFVSACSLHLEKQREKFNLNVAGAVSNWISTSMQTISHTSESAELKANTRRSWIKGTVQHFSKIAYCHNRWSLSVHVVMRSARQRRELLSKHNWAEWYRPWPSKLNKNKIPTPKRSSGEFVTCAFTRQAMKYRADVPRLSLPCLKTNLGCINIFTQSAYANRPPPNLATRLNTRLGGQLKCVSTESIKESPGPSGFHSKHHTGWV